jgi:hypothetical protein
MVSLSMEAMMGLSADADILCNKDAMIRDMTKETPCVCVFRITCTLFLLH